MREPDATVVLIVEDDIVTREAMADLLVGTFQVLEAGGVVEAVAILEARGDVAVVVTDVEMPGAMDGLDLALMLSRWAPWISVVIASGLKAPRAPAFAVLTKPYPPDRLPAVVRKAAAASGRQREPGLSFLRKPGD